MSRPVVELDDARFGYQRSVMVRATCRIEAGEVLAVLGPNGAGKSTLVRGLLGLADLYGGRVEWFDRHGAGRGARGRIGYVPQRSLGVSPIPSTVTELVESGRVAQMGVFGRRRAADRTAIAEAIDAVGLSDHARRPVGWLSGGQQRRALVARGLAGGVSLLVLDEPFAGVDADSQAQIAGTLRDLVARDVTLIVVLHELGPLAGFMTRAIELDAGEVVYDGPPRATSNPNPDVHASRCEPPPRHTGLGLLTANHP